MSNPIYNVPCKREGCPEMASKPGYCTHLCEEVDKAFRYVLRRAQNTSDSGGDVGIWAPEWSALLEVAEAVNAWQVVVRQRVDSRVGNARVS